MKLMKCYMFLLLIINIYTSPPSPSPSPTSSSFNWTSPCESINSPPEYESCKKRNTEYIYETCCFMEATQYGKYDTECVEVSRDDVRNKGDVEKTRQRILEGKYWVDEPEPYDSIDKLICSSDYIFTSIFLLFLMFLI